MWMRFADQGPKPTPPHPEATPEVPPEVSPPPPGDDAPASSDTVDEGLPTYGEEIGATLLAILPWAISGLLHVGLVILAVFVVWSIVSTARDEDIIVPVVELSATPGTPLQVQPSERDTPLNTSRRRVIQTSSSTSPALSTRVDLAATNLGASTNLTKRSPFDSADASDAQFKTQFFGSGGNARRIAFLVDASGSLIDSFPFVLDELNKSIQRLSAKQRFTVIFFQGDKALEVPPAGLKPATAANKAAVIQWIKPEAGNVRAEFRTNPLNALRTALRYRPQLIFLLSDNIIGSGRYQIDQNRLVDAIQQANTAGTKINTIQFLYADPLSKLGLKGTMQRIAESTGGTYKFIDQKELDYNTDQR